ncbi:MAG: Crp/Fnr family transcriptional regulator, partial [Deltaproteobacteria bacterium]|nr:Crp/Fnr family transcriptional regulator [Deltaproteobacteria bacterium]
NGFFSALSPESLSQCNQHTTNTYKAGQVLFYEGNRAYGVHCLYAGRIKLYKTGHGGRLQIVRLAGPGDLIGYRALFAEEPYAATAEAMEDATVCFVERSVFLQLLTQNPAVSMKMIRKLAQELRHAEDQMTDIAQKPVKERLAELLLLLKETYGKPTKEGLEIGIALSREEMAEMIGTTQETIIRLLSAFRARGFLQVDGRKIVILDCKPLLRIAQIEI